jgi:lysine-ketoglutarate reductase/saccharopine dehydrogenase-like protein (TIGR00300 family)
VSVSETVEVSGHLMDTGLLARVLDDVLGYGGDYRIDRLDVGRAHDDESQAKITVSAEDHEALQRLLMRLQAHGVNQVDPGEAFTRICDRDGVFPDDFYSTTNLETVVRLGAQWVPVEQPEMDCGLVVAGGRVRTVPVSDIHAGDTVVCGASGVKVVLPAREHSTTTDAFEFMSSSVSSEKPQALLVRQIAQRMREVKADGQKVLWVGGPGIVHTGAAPAFTTLVEHGYVDVLFAGNALATHDIESALYGTSLGVDLTHGTGVEHGHEHHIRAINTIRRCGSISNAVSQGVLTRGIMHAMARSPTSTPTSSRVSGPCARSCPGSGSRSWSPPCCTRSPRGTSCRPRSPWSRSTSTRRRSPSSPTVAPRRRSGSSPTSDCSWSSSPASSSRASPASDPARPAEAPRTR